MRWKKRHYLPDPILIIRWWKKRLWALRPMSWTHHQHTTSYCNICQPTNSVWAHLMGHFDIIYIHKWNYGDCGCCLHWQDVKNSWQIKKKVDRCATYLNLNMALWTSGDPSPLSTTITESFSDDCLCTSLPLSLGGSLQMACTFITTCMFVCVRQVFNMPMIMGIFDRFNAFLSLTVKHGDFVRVCVQSHIQHVAELLIERKKLDWDERRKKRESGMQKDPFCTLGLSAFSTVMHLRPE